MLPKRLNGVSYTSASEMTSLVTFWLPSTTRDNNGTLAAPTQVATVAAAIRMTSQPTDVAKQQQVIGQTRYKIVIRYMSGLTTAMYATTATGRRFTLTSIVDPDDRQAELQIYAMEHS